MGKASVQTIDLPPGQALSTPADSTRPDDVSEVKQVAPMVDGKDLGNIAAILAAESSSPI